MNYLNGFGKDLCSHCNMKRTIEGFDGCVGKLDNVMNACCGHGDLSMAYVQFNHENYENEPNKILIEGIEAIEYINEFKK